MVDTLLLTGDDLTVDDVWTVAVERAEIGLAATAVERMRAARALVEAAAAGEHTYGVNTGFGRFVSRSIPDELAGELQLRLLRSHACGVGDPYPPEVVRAAMLLRANALAKGFSGARPDLVELLVACLNRGVLPLRPVARLGRCKRRPGPARASRAAARRGGVGAGRGEAVARRRGAAPRAGSSRSSSPRRRGCR